MRIIARLDIKNEHVIKGIHLEGLRKVGNPNELALKYYSQGIDEIVFMDSVASLYDRNNLFDIVKSACKDVFVPIALGGGIRTVEDVDAALGSGADKVIINTAAIRDITLVERLAHKYGSQCIVGSIEAKRNTSGWLAYTDNGREPSDYCAIEWARVLQDAGCGEIMITSVDKEGTRRGFDLDLILEIQESVSRPVIVSGGLGNREHLIDLCEKTVPSAVAVASALHYNIMDVDVIKKCCDRQVS